jgi:hypothetical protein
MTDERMPGESGGDQTTGIERARLCGRRVAHAAVIGVAAAFIWASAWQIASAVFGLGEAPVAATWETASPSDRACALGLQTLMTALDRAGASSAGAATTPPDDAAVDFRHALSPEWEGAASIARACSASPRGLDAWAALERLQIAEEQLTRSARSDLDPLRRDLATHLPSDLR